MSSRMFHCTVIRSYDAFAFHKPLSFNQITLRIIT